MSSPACFKTADWIFQNNNENRQQVTLLLRCLNTQRWPGPVYLLVVSLVLIVTVSIIMFVWDSSFSLTFQTTKLHSVSALHYIYIILNIYQSFRHDFKRAFPAFSLICHSPTWKFLWICWECSPRTTPYLILDLLSPKCEESTCKGKCS